MPVKTIKIPLEVKNGKLKTIYGKDAVQQIVMFALSPSDNSNPFQQQIGIGYDAVFTDERNIGIIYTRVERIMTRLETQNIAKLVPGGIDIQNMTDGEFSVKIKYVDLETDSEETVIIPPIRGVAINA